MSPYSYSNSNELIAYPVYGYTWTYDNNGNTTGKTVSGSTTTFNWDFENRLTSVVLPGTGGTVSFKYDPFGRRIYKSSSSSTTIYAYDGDNRIEDLSSTGMATARYTQGLGIDEPLEVYEGGKSYYYHADGLGSIVALTKSTGTAANTYFGYNTFGGMPSPSETVANPFRFTAREWDSETSLYYYRARYYDSLFGRFLSEDPQGVQDNIDMYVYVANNPATYEDPWGLYTLKGFTPDQQARMQNAIKRATDKLGSSCPSCAGPDGPKIANAIQGATFIYDPNMKTTLCGQTGPLSFLGVRHVVKLGPNAFTPFCCSLASTIAHEATHLVRGNENKAQDVEKACFGCNN